MAVDVAEALPSRTVDSGFDLEFIGNDGKLVSGRLEDYWHHRFEEAPPFREFPSFKGQKNFSGLWWSPKSSGHVGYESWLERDHAMMLDFTPGVKRFSSQPFQMLWRDGRRLCRHVPDYFARLEDGTGMVLDVRPERLIKPADAAAFAAAQRLCDSVGWLFRRVGELDPVLCANVRWLSAYRHPRCLREDLAESVKEAFRAALRGASLRPEPGYPATCGQTRNVQQVRCDGIPG